jgi:hypothetical protein
MNCVSIVSLYQRSTNLVVTVLIASSYHSSIQVTITTNIMLQYRSVRYFTCKGKLINLKLCEIFLTYLCQLLRFCSYNAMTIPTASIAIITTFDPLLFPPTLRRPRAIARTPPPQPGQHVNVGIVSSQYERS